MLDVMFNGEMLWFTVPAVAGTALFLVRLAAMMLGHHGGGIDTAHDLGHLHPDSDGHFGWVSFQSAMAMAMGFGWGGIGAYKGSHLSAGVSALVGVVCGVAMVALLLVLMRNVRRLAASGNVPIDTLAGAEGDTASAVPARGRGRGEVRLVVGARERRCWAVSADSPIASRSRVRVVAVNPDNTVTVQPI